MQYILMSGGRYFVGYAGYNIPTWGHRSLAIRYSREDALILKRRFNGAGLFVQEMLA